MPPDMRLDSTQWSGKRLLLEALVDGEPYQADELSMHRVIRKAMAAATADSHIDFEHSASQFRDALGARATAQHQQRLKRAGRWVAARRRPKAKPKAKPTAKAKPAPGR